MPRFHCPALLATGAELDLPPGAARHVQVLRLQPGDTITLFHGGQAEGDPGGEFDATILKMGRSDVRVVVGAPQAPPHHAPARPGRARRAAARSCVRPIAHTCTIAPR